MPIDATQAALIGAGIGAAATTVGSALTALVTRRNSYAQHLYVKRAEAYEDLLRGMATWIDKSPEERQKQQFDVTIRSPWTTTMCGWRRPDRRLVPDSTTCSRSPHGTASALRRGASFAVSRKRSS
jgi:hypothetical protein